MSARDPTPSPPSTALLDSRASAASLASDALGLRVDWPGARRTGRSCGECSAEGGPPGPGPARGLGRALLCSRAVVNVVHMGLRGPRRNAEAGATQPDDPTTRWRTCTAPAGAGMSDGGTLRREVHWGQRRRNAGHGLEADRPLLSDPMRGEQERSEERPRASRRAARRPDHLWLSVLSHAGAVGPARTGARGGWRAALRIRSPSCLRSRDCRVL